MERLHFYRGKFIWSVVITTIAIAIMFGSIAHFYQKSLAEIVEIHQNYNKELRNTLKTLTVSKDSNIYVNEQLANSMQEHMQSTQTLLQIQSSKIQSDFTLLSVWAGILMIVFLIFSIYSIFKTDELMKQSREGLKAIEDTKNKADGYVTQIDARVENEIKQVSSAAEEQIQKISTETSSLLDQFKVQVAEEQKTFASVTENKAKEFQKVYDEYVQKLKGATEQTNSLFEALIKAVKNQQSEEQESDKNRQEKRE